MKKVTIILAAILFVAVVSSCQGGKKCPAYSQVTTEEVQSNS